MVGTPSRNVLEYLNLGSCFVAAEKIATKISKISTWGARRSSYSPMLENATPCEIKQSYGKLHIKQREMYAQCFLARHLLLVFPLIHFKTSTWFEILFSKLGELMVIGSLATADPCTLLCTPVVEGDTRSPQAGVGPGRCGHLCIRATGACILLLPSALAGACGSVRPYP